jgi:hypothetical protein
MEADEPVLQNTSGGNVGVSATVTSLVGDKVTSTNFLTWFDLMARQWSLPAAGV